MEQLAGAVRRHTRVARPSLSVGVADSPDVIRAAQELRYRVFADEMGANLSTALGSTTTPSTHTATTSWSGTKRTARSSAPTAS